MGNKLTDYLQNSYKELKKVVWPSRAEVIQHTLMVIVISVGVAIFLGGVDYVFNYLISLIYS